MNKYIYSLLMAVLSAGRVASQQVEPEMADAFRAEGKIYVVVVVCLIVLFGLIGYLTYLDRRIKKLEDSSK
ncbi:MAG: CcmD family protein [Thermaurantimonas sp.]|uniref:CcmD family protein n=1 Tax=Thermaurantimonas sp. TaxID=2681568 RepID=UPI00391ACB70